MNSEEILKLLKSVEAGKLSPQAAVEKLKHLPFEDIDFAKVDHHRALRQGYAEVIFGKGKTPGQVAEIVRAMVRHKDSRHNILVTRADDENLCGREAGEPMRRNFILLSGVITIERSKRNYREGNDFGCFGGHQRYSRGGRSAADGAVDGKSRGASL